MIRSTPTVRFAPLLLILVGCHREPEPVATPTPAPTPQPRRMTLTAGTAVKLVLLDELTSGGTAEGSTVRLALAEPVGDLPAMTPAIATVSESRTEGTLGALMNQPARLNLTLGSITGPDGQNVLLSADPKQPKDYELNRGNTGRPEAAQKAPEEVDVSAGVAVQELIEKGQSGGLDPKQVGDLARKLGMSETAKLADAGQLDRAQQLVRTVRQGGSVASLATGGTVAAALEMVNLAATWGTV